MRLIAGMGIVVTEEEGAIGFALPGEVCEPSIANGKRCPDFGDGPLEVHCCASRVKPGTFYCCNAEAKAADLGYVNGLSREGRLILGSVGGCVALVLSVLLLWCLCSSSCPLHRWRRRKRQMSEPSECDRPVVSTTAPSRHTYRPVSTQVLEPPNKPYPPEPPPAYAEAANLPSVPPFISSPAYAPLPTSSPGPRPPASSLARCSEAPATVQNALNARREAASNSSNRSPVVPKSTSSTIA